MIERIPAAPAATPIRLHAWYRSIGALLRELSRALNQGQTLLRGDSGLPVGSGLVLVLSAKGLSAPIEVRGTVTACRPRRGKHEMALRYDFDPGPHRRRLEEAMAGLRRETRRPRTEPRVPLALRAETATSLRGLTATIANASRKGARLELCGRRLPTLTIGSRLVMTLAGSGAGKRSPLRLVVEVRWAGRARRAGGGRVQEVGGRFVGLTPALRNRVQAILRFEDVRPRLTITSVEPAQRPTRR